MKRLVLVFLIAPTAACTEHKCLQNAGPAIPAEQLRDPQTGQCESVGQPYPCDSACGPCLAPGAGAPDWASCSGACESLSEAQCLASTGCHAAYSDDPTPSPVFWGCWDVPPSGPITDPCSGLDAQTCSEDTSCASLYTGPVNQPQGFVPSFEKCIAKPGAPPACSTLTTESACTARSDCDPIYDGSNCTCDKSGCTCQTETFARCR